MELEEVEEYATEVELDGIMSPVCHLLCGNPIPVCSCGSVPTSEGFVNKMSASTMRDSGCVGVIVKAAYVEPSQYTGQYKCCLLVDGTTRKFPTARVQLDSPYYTGVYEAMVVPTPPFDVIVGNIQGAESPERPRADWKPKHLQEMSLTAAVTTRLQKEREKKALKPLLVPESTNDITDKDTLLKQQKEDPSLNGIWTKAHEKVPPKMTKTGQAWFVVQDELLYRCYQKLQGVKRPIVKQLVVPQCRREQVLKIAHESIMAGHLGIQRTTDRVLSRFYWPGIHSSIVQFCRSCDRCQKTEPKGKVPKATLEEMPVIDTPFKRIAIDIVGPITPLSERKNRYILTIVDFATRYPEAVPLPSIETERVAEALLEVYSRVGFPTEVLSDMGTNFTSSLMREVNRLISVRQLTTMPYHPICNGLCEKYNGTLKQVLRRLCSERPKDWDRYLPAVLFAYREVPQESLGFSPFELVYGRTVRGPMDILQSLWTGEVKEDEVKTTYTYVLELRERLEKTCELAHEELNKARKKYKRLYDRKARNRQLQAGDQVLILLANDGNKLLMEWKGPFDVVERVGRNDYKIKVKDKQRLFHINMLKKYIPRDQELKSSCLCQIQDCDCKPIDIVATAIIPRCRTVG